MVIGGGERERITVMEAELLLDLYSGSGLPKNKEEEETMATEESWNSGSLSASKRDELEKENNGWAGKRRVMALF